MQGVTQLVWVRVQESAFLISCQVMLTQMTLWVEMYCSTSQTWVGIRVTWRAYSNTDCWGPPPEFQMPSVWGVDWKFKFLTGSSDAETAVLETTAQRLQSCKACYEQDEMELGEPIAVSTTDGHHVGFLMKSKNWYSIWIQQIERDSEEKMK